MRSSIAILPLLCLALARSTVATECSQRCSASKGDIQASMRTACKKEMTQLPKPQVGKFCKAGFTDAFERVCVEACESGGSLSAASLRGFEQDACAVAAKAIPKPLCRNACRTGFEAGAKHALATVAVFTAEVLANRVFAEEEEEGMLVEDDEEVDEALAAVASAFAAAGTGVGAAAFAEAAAIATMEEEQQNRADEIQESFEEAFEEVEELIEDPDWDAIGVPPPPPASILEIPLELGDERMVFSVLEGQDADEEARRFCQLHMDTAAEVEICFENLSALMQEQSAMA